MTLDVILPIAVGLAMDAFSVAIATSVRFARVSRRQIFRFAFHFGLFQALMPFIGWWMGLRIEGFVRTWAHWIAFGLLVGIGVKALCEAFSRDEEEGEPATDPTRGWSLVFLSVATSIDALAVGLSFAFLQLHVGLACLAIGVVTALLTMGGMVFGARLGDRFGKRVEILGGLVLIGIGVKILLFH